MPMTEQRFLGLGPHGFHEIAYFQWGDPLNEKVLVCVHGLTRRGRDFDLLAQALEDHYRVICVDLPGRGHSDWLAVAADYQPMTYVQDMAALIARLNVRYVDWVGVSLGGLVGMTLAIQPKTPIRKLVLDDIGAFVAKDALEVINGYVGRDPTFDDVKGLEAYMREINTGYGQLTDAQWAFLAQNAARQDKATGKWHQHYDPKIAEPFREGFSEDVSLWPVWDAIPCPTLVLRGALSEILTRETAEEMMARKPGAKLVEFADAGHAPMLLDPAQIAPVCEFLLG